MIIVKDLHIYNPQMTVLLLNIPELIIEDGSVYFFRGDSGRGKTLLLKTLTNQYSFFSGNIIIDELLLESYNYMRFAHLVQFVDQHYPLFLHMTVMEQLTHPLIYAFKKEEIVAVEMATDALHQMGLYADRNKYPSELSGGQRQRIAILQKILLKPNYLFLDEPTSGLDRNNKFHLLRLLQSYFDSGMKIILSSHDFETINFFDNKKIFDL